MSQQPQTKYTPGYRVQLYALILRCVEKQTAGKTDQTAKDAKYIAHQQLRQATDEAERG